MQASANRLCLRLFIGRCVDHLERVHTPQYVVTSYQGALGIDHRVIARRRFWQTCQHGRFDELEVGDFFAVIDLGCSSEAIGAIAEIDLVDIKLEYFVFFQQTLNLERQKYLADFSYIGFLTCQEKVTRHLHRDGTATLRTSPTRLGHTDSSTYQPLVINARVLIKALVFSGDDCILEAIRHLGNLHGFSSLLPIFGDQIAFSGINS